MTSTDLHLQGMEDIITCSICQELYTDARELKCKHCFCLACLRDFQTTVVNKPCPMCREDTVPPARELHRLPANQAVNDMVGLVMRHKEGVTVTQTSNTQGPTLPQKYNPREGAPVAKPATTAKPAPTRQPTPPQPRQPPPPQNRPKPQESPAPPRRSPSPPRISLADLLGGQRHQPKPKPKPRSDGDALSEALREAFSEALSSSMGGRRRPPSSSSSSSSDGEAISPVDMLAALLSQSQLPGAQQMMLSNAHRNIVCDGCKAQNFTGSRFKCGVCDDFDLCENCERKPRQLVHDGKHPFVKLKRPAEQRVPQGRILDDDLALRGMSMNLNTNIHTCTAVVGEILGTVLTKNSTIECDRCGKDPIVGTRYKCGMCNDYDLCEDCEKKSHMFHHRDHVFIVLKHPTTRTEQKGRSLRVNFY